MIPILKDQLLLSSEEEAPFSKDIMIINLNKNMIMSPSGIRNREWLVEGQKQTTARLSTRRPLMMETNMCVSETPDTNSP
jgi:hypothetical protein